MSLDESCGSATVLVPTDSADTAPTSAAGASIAVGGDLPTGFERIDNLTGDGSMLGVVPDEGLFFDNGAPVSHAQNHVLSGQPVAAESDAGRTASLSRLRSGMPATESP